jgi:hypothetical protein
MQNDNFVEQYMDNCLDSGIVKPDAMCNKALAEITDIDKSLEGYRELRIRRNNLMQVLRALNHEEGHTKRRRLRQIPVFDSENMTADETAAFKEIADSICVVMEKSDFPPTMRDILTNTDYDTKDPTPFYRVAKKLFDTGVIARKDDRTLIPGPNWETR